MPTKISFSLTLFLFYFVITSSTASPFQQKTLQAFYDSLTHPILNEDSAAHITNTVIFRGGQEIDFIDGTLRLAKPVSGKYYCAVYSGKGKFLFAPPTQLERAECENMLNISPVNGIFEFQFIRAVFWFDEQLLKEFGTDLALKKFDINRVDRESVERSVKYATDKVNENVIYHLLTEMLEEHPKQYLFAHFFLGETKEIFFNYDVRRFEEVSLYKPPFESITGSVFWLQMVNSFHSLDEYTSKTEYELTEENKLSHDIISNTIDLTIEKGGHTTATATVIIRPLGTPSPTFLFGLDPTLEVDSIIGRNGIRLPFLRQKETWEGLILLPGPDTSEYKLHFSYSGDFLSQLKGGVYMSRGGRNTTIIDVRKASGAFYKLASSTGWYPQQPSIDRMVFDMTFHIPDDMELAAAGKLQNESQSSNKKTLHYVTTVPSAIASFTIGYLKKITLNSTIINIPITILDAEGGDPESVAKDIENSFNLYTFLFGPVPYTELKVTPGAMTHGQAFQEFLHLPWFGELVGKKDKTVELGRAHEVSHAWWGHGVGWKSYHDQWLSEAFAEYSSLLYAPFVLKTDQPFFDKLKEWKEEIIGTRKFALGSGKPLGSIWLGYRASSSQTREDYSISTYHKGAWVLHMLRMMMLDLTTLKEDNFKSMMSEFYQSYLGKDPTTNDFRKLTEKYLAADMKWFFDQWIIQSEIPTLKCVKNITKMENGKYKLAITIEQKDVTNPFTLYLPFELKYKNGATARARLFLNKKLNDFSYELDNEPENITFNIMESVLCLLEE